MTLLGSGSWKKEDEKRPMRSPGLELDYEIARQIGDGKQVGLERLVERQLAPLHGYLSRRLGPGQEELVEEVVKATFAEAMKKLRPYQRGATTLPMRLWFLRMANRHLARQQARIRNYELRITNYETEKRHSVGRESEQLGRLRAAMRDMSPRQQAALALALFEEMPPDEIAAALGVSPGRAMRILREALRRAGGGQSSDSFLEMLEAEC